MMIDLLIIFSFFILTEIDFASRDAYEEICGLTSSIVKERVKMRRQETFYRQI